MLPIVLILELHHQDYYTAKIFLQYKNKTEFIIAYYTTYILIIYLMRTKDKTTTTTLVSSVQQPVAKLLHYRRIAGAPCGDLIEYIKIRQIMALLARNNSFNWIKEM